MTDRESTLIESMYCEFINRFVSRSVYGQFNVSTCIHDRDTNSSRFDSIYLSQTNIYKHLYSQ